MKIAEDIFKYIFNESAWISITISLKFVLNGPIDCKSGLVQVMDWRHRREAITRINADPVHWRI